MALFSAFALVATQNSSRYLVQLCKHWSHHLAVEFTPEHGSVVFPRDLRGADHPDHGVVTFGAEKTALRVRIHASSAEQLAGLKDVVSNHLDRFAFREAPLGFNWQEVT